MNSLRKLWTPKIFTPQGYTKDNILEGKKALDIGCGSRKLPGADGMDEIALPGVTIVHNTDTFPWPIADSTYDLVFSSHFLEHSKDVVKVMEEAARVLKPGGRFVAQVPYFRSLDAFSDPTHESFFTSQSLDYFCTNSSLSNYKYSNVAFKKLGFWYGWPQKSANPIASQFKKFIHSHPTFYDQYLSLFIPTKCLTWELEVLK